MTLDELLAQIHGEPGLGYKVAGRSYMNSGYYEQARSAFKEARKRGVGGEDLDSLDAYAAGMRAYLDGNYPECVASLSAWIATFDAAADPELVTLANAAVSRIGKFLDPDSDRALISEAAALFEKLGGSSDRDRSKSEHV